MRAVCSDREVRRETMDRRDSRNRSTEEWASWFSSSSSASSSNMRRRSLLASFTAATAFGTSLIRFTFRFTCGRNQRFDLCVIENTTATTTYHLPRLANANGANDKVGEVLLTEQRHLHRPVHVRLVLLHRPVLAAHHPNEVEHLGQHHHHKGLLLPDQPPKVGDGVLVRSLRGDVRVRLEDALPTKKRY